MDSSTKNNRPPNRVHPREVYLRSKISEYSGYAELLKGLLGKHGETHDKAIEAAIEALSREIYSLQLKLKSDRAFHY